MTTEMIADLRKKAYDADDEEVRLAPGDLLDLLRDLTGWQSEARMQKCLADHLRERLEGNA